MDANQPINVPLKIEHLARMHIALTIAIAACDRSAKANRAKGKDQVAKAEENESRIFSEIRSIIERASVT